MALHRMHLWRYEMGVLDGENQLAENRQAQKLNAHFPTEKFHHTVKFVYC